MIKEGNKRGQVVNADVVWWGIGLTFLLLVVFLLYSIFSTAEGAISIAPDQISTLTIACNNAGLAAQYGTEPYLCKQFIEVKSNSLYVTCDFLRVNNGAEIKMSGLVCNEENVKLAAKAKCKDEGLKSTARLNNWTCSDLISGTTTGVVFNTATLNCANVVQTASGRSGDANLGSAKITHSGAWKTTEECTAAKGLSWAADTFKDSASAANAGKICCGVPKTA